MLSNEQAAIFFQEPLLWNATLSIHFSYSLAFGDTGYHLTAYTAGDGTRLLYGATHMEVCLFYRVEEHPYCTPVASSTIPTDWQLHVGKVCV